jgi:glucokinase
MKTEVIELVPGSLNKIDPVGPKVCVGAGTGLGECFLTTSSLNPEVGYECFPTEGGHVEYAPRNELEVKMWMALKKKFRHSHRISVERIVSGKGIANVYEFLAGEFPDQIDCAIHEQFLVAGDLQGKIVGDNVKDGNLCEQAIRIFMG